MGLLPNLFNNTDPMPMALGKKIETPAPKKPDPIAAFERGNHLPAGYVAFDMVAWWSEAAPFKSDIYQDVYGALFEADASAGANKTATEMLAKRQALKKSVPWDHPSRTAFIASSIEYNDV